MSFVHHQSKLTASLAERLARGLAGIASLQIGISCFDGGQTLREFRGRWILGAPNKKEIVNGQSNVATFDSLAREFKEIVKLLPGRHFHVHLIRSGSSIAGQFASLQFSLPEIRIESKSTRRRAPHG
jgi:hypothetical protein